jgi:hypothetical protein
MVTRQQLVKYAAGAATAGRFSKALAALDSAPEAVLGRVFGGLTGPVLKAPVNLADTVLRGSVNRAGPLKGTRLHARYGPGSTRPITMERYNSVIKGATPGMVFKYKGVPVERTTSYGGVAGLAQRHPFIAGAGVLAAGSDNPIADMLSPQGTVRYGLGGFAPNLAPTPEFTQIANTPALANNVLSRGADPRYARNSKNQWRYDYAQQLPEQQPPVQEPVA